jgi:predicted DNA-binding ribbon-helix-helix protein
MRLWNDPSSFYWLLTQVGDNDQLSVIAQLTDKINNHASQLCGRGVD